MHGNGLPLDVVAELKTIFLRLSEDSFLKRCLDEKTQNQNKSLNGMIWDRLPKQVVFSSQVLSLGVYGAVAHFNVGARGITQVLEKMQHGR